MPDDKDGSYPKNPFVRFKRHIDAYVGEGLNHIIGLPSLVAQNLNLHSGRQDSEPAACERNDTMNTPFTSLQNTFGTGASAGSGNDGNSRSDHSPGALGRRGPGLGRSDHDADGADRRWVEAVLQHLSGGTLDEAAFAWTLFAARSQYSPLKLDKTVPVPRAQDLPAHIAAKASWTDVFEDLLTVSSGLPLRDAQQVEDDYQKEQLQKSLFGGLSHSVSALGSLLGDRERGPFAANVRTSATFHGPQFEAITWGNLFSARPIGEAFFPVHDPKYGYTSPRTMEEWAERHRRYQELRDVYQEARDGFGGTLPFGFGRERADRSSVNTTGPEEVFLRSMLKGVQSAAEANNSTAFPRKNVPEYENWTEQDAYTTAEETKSSMPTTEHSSMWPRFKANWSMQSTSSEQIDGGSTTNEVKRDKTGKTVRTTKKVVDADGNVHVTTTTLKTNTHGEEVQNETVYRCWSPSRQLIEERHTSNAGNEHDKKWSKRDSPSDSEKKDGTGGWFW